MPDQIDILKVVIEADAKNRAIKVERITLSPDQREGLRTGLSSIPAESDDLPDMFMGEYVTPATRIVRHNRSPYSRPTLIGCHRRRSIWLHPVVIRSALWGVFGIIIWALATWIR